MTNFSTKMIELFSCVAQFKNKKNKEGKDNHVCKYLQIKKNKTPFQQNKTAFYPTETPIYFPKSAFCFGSYKIWAFAKRNMGFCHCHFGFCSYICKIVTLRFGIVQRWI